MSTMFVRHNVADYAAWRKAYDDFDAERRSMGVTGATVYRSADDPSEVTITHDFATVDAAKEFSQSPRLHEVMQQAGVQGEPTIWFTESA